MKFLHTSDWHFGATENEHSLLSDQRYFVDRICEIITERKIDAVLLAGDVYDRSVAAADAVRLYDYAMTRICRDLGVQVISVAGNHDSAERLASCSELLKEAGLSVSGALTREPRKVEFEDTDIYLLPWFTEEKVRGLFPEKAADIRSMDDAYRVVTESLRADFVPGKKHFAVAHAFISGVELGGSDRAAEIGFATQVSASVFDGFDYVALGHIHRPYNVNEHIRYSGTPMPYSFGKEEAQEKSVTIIDTENMTQEIVPLPLLHCWTTLTGTMEELMHPDLAAEVQNGYVRINVTDTFVGTESGAALRALYPLALDIMGKEFEDLNGGTRMTLEELRELETDPVEVFKRFYIDSSNGEEASEHLLDLFRQVLEECGTED